MFYDTNLYRSSPTLLEFTSDDIPNNHEVTPIEPNEAVAVDPLDDSVVVCDETVPALPSSILIPNEVWTVRIQDRGCNKSELEKKTYKKSQIPGIGPDDDKRYYYGLASIAIDFIKLFNKEQELGKGWSKVPKNKTDVKITIIKRIQGLRKEGDNGKYTLSQATFVGMMENVWGARSVDTTPHHNDRVRLFGMIMTLLQFREVYQKLAEGVTSRDGIDDPNLNNTQMFQNLAFSFGNEEVVITLPEEACDLDRIEEINPNDITRIRITRDCKVYVFNQYLLL